jgi:Family of unknown function (DUF6444)
VFSRFSISDEEWQQTPTAVQQAFSSLHHQLLLEVRSQAYERQLAQLREQVAQIDDLKAEMVELREHLGQNSGNSSKPPSSDLPRQPQQVQRQPSGRKAGGQPNHPGSGRKLKAVAQVDRVIDLRPASCSHCGGLLLGDDPRPARHQVSEIPPTQPVVTLLGKSNMPVTAVVHSVFEDQSNHRPLSDARTPIAMAIGHHD